METGHGSAAVNHPIDEEEILVKLPMSASSTFMATSGDGYELQMGRWSRRLAEPFIDFVGTADDERVLDVGCGTGCLSFALTRRCRVARLCGIDFSPAYVEHARRNARDPKIEFRVGDVCALDFPDRSFDRVLALLVLHFVPDADRAIAEMRRVARPGAVVGAAVWDVRGGFVANRVFFDTAAALDAGANERRARNYTRPMTRPGALFTAWSAAGFENVVESDVSIRMEFASFDDYWAPYEGQDGPQAEYVASLSPAARARLRDAVRHAYVGGEDDGPRSFVAVARAVKGLAPGGPGVALRPAVAADAVGVAACVCAAYLPYIERIGRQPGPMLENYAEVLERLQVHVAEREGRIVGVLVLEAGAGGVFIDNVAVHPTAQGSGVGRRLLEYAEARARALGHSSIELSTNERMFENQALYSRIGYAAFDRRVVDGYARVFMRKPLA